MTDLRAVANLIIVYMRRDCPQTSIAEDEVCIESILREVAKNARIEEASNWAMSSAKSQRELKDKLDKAVLAIKEARSDAYESAAQLVEDLERGSNLFSRIAAKIRALKDSK